TCVFILFCQHNFYFLFFFFQAEDGIRDRNVTGVQTCALPILAILASTKRISPNSTSASCSKPFSNASINSCFSSENLSHSSCLFSQSKPILAVFLCIDSGTSKAGESQFIFSNREWCSTLCFSSAFSSSNVFSFSLFPNTW